MTRSVDASVYRRVECPYCRALELEACTTPSGRPFRGSDYDVHESRVRVYVNAVRNRLTRWKLLFDDWVFGLQTGDVVVGFRDVEFVQAVYLETDNGLRELPLRYDYTNLEWVGWFVGETFVIEA